MAISVNFELKDKYVLITSEGERKDFSSVVEGTTRLYEIIEKTKCNLVLLDYRKVIFNVPQTDAFNILRLYEIKMPMLTNIKIAVAVGEKSSGFGAVWKDVAHARGFNYEIFNSLEEAEAWLVEES